jgi:SAM-dependent methyltransferase
MQLKIPSTTSQIDILAGEEYVRQRARPRCRDTDFLILSDLLCLLERLAVQASGLLFDYGCGGAPYRSLFKQCERYIRADIAPGPGVDRVLAPDGSTREESATYDVVLSTQVLEHARNPRRHLEEVHRILKPGGRLILTTHGMFHEHGCPDDFHRWTSHGLEQLLRSEGFTVLESYKLTADVRGAIQLLHYLVSQGRCQDKPLGKYCWAIVKRVYRWWFQPLFNCLAKLLERQGVVPSNDPASVYVGLGALAQKAQRPERALS